MGNVGEVETELFHVEETIFVAVGKNVENHKTLLFWTLQNFPGTKICLLHLSSPSPSPSPERKVEGGAVEEVPELQVNEMDSVLDHYHEILAQEGVHFDIVWIEVESVKEGIVEIIIRHSVRWLVMGAAADCYFSKKLMGLKSEKAIYVCQHAPLSCHIWFLCKGCLIYTSLLFTSVEAEIASLWNREGRSDESEAEIASSLLQLNFEPDQLENLRSAAEIYRSLDVEDNTDDDFDEASESFNYQCLQHTDGSTSLAMRMLEDEEGKTQEQVAGRTTSAIERAIIDSKYSKKKTSEEAIRWWKEEDNAVGLKCKAKALESLCIKEISLRKEIEESLDRERKEVERMRSQHDENMKELSLIREQILVLQSQLADSDCMVKELEGKIISAVDLLIRFRERRDAAHIECENAKKEVEKQRRLEKMGAAGFCWSEILEFSFMEINEATNYFDPSWKIGEGRNGTVYRGLLRHVYVAIKMLPSYGLQSKSEFQYGIEVLSRVRHQNLVTLIGTCPESRSLVYEYAKNGSLEERLTCKGKTRPLPWQTRVKITLDICSALIFLHSNKPYIVHGNLKPSNVLLDASFVSKLSNFGLLQLMKQGQTVGYGNQISKGSNAYIDPEYLDSGIPGPESDVLSFGFILLRLLTARPVSGVVKDVKCALENDNLKAVLDCSAGDWPLEQAKQLANLALKCCERNRMQRPNLVLDVWKVLEPMKTSVANPELRSGSKEVHGAPSHFVCPIFQEVMKDPHIAADGFTYEGDAIKGWLKSGHNTSPMTNLKLDHCNLFPNHALHQAIQEWQQQH